MGKPFIKKVWCTYGLMPHSVGQVVADRGSSVDILYADGQLYPAESWDARYVRRFEAPEEAIAHLLMYVDDRAETVVDIFRNNFNPPTPVDIKAVKKHRDRMEREQKKVDDERHGEWKRKDRLEKRTATIKRKRRKKS